MPDDHRQRQTRHKRHGDLVQLHSCNCLQVSAVRGHLEAEHLWSDHRHDANFLGVVRQGAATGVFVLVAGRDFEVVFVFDELGISEDWWQCLHHCSIRSYVALAGLIVVNLAQVDAKISVPGLWFSSFRTLLLVLSINLNVFVPADAASCILIALEFILVLVNRSGPWIHRPVSDPALHRLYHMESLLDLCRDTFAVDLTFAVVYNSLGLDNLIRHENGLRRHLNFEVSFSLLHAPALGQSSMFQLVGGRLEV